MASAARWAAASAPASTVLNVTSEYAAACALALLVMAAIQPWSAAGAEKPMVTFLPGSAFGLPASAPLVCAVVGAVSLLVHAGEQRAGAERRAAEQQPAARQVVTVLGHDDLLSRVWWSDVGVR